MPRPQKLSSQSQRPPGNALRRFYRRAGLATSVLLGAVLTSGGHAQPTLVVLSATRLRVSALPPAEHSHAVYARRDVGEVALSDDEGRPLSGKSIQVKARSDTSDALIDVTTGSRGTAIFSWPEHIVPPLSLAASFAGDDEYDESSSLPLAIDSTANHPSGESSGPAAAPVFVLLPWSLSLLVLGLLALSKGELLRGLALPRIEQRRPRTEPTWLTDHADDEQRAADRVHGLILDRETGVPIEGARLTSIVDPSAVVAVSDSGGHYCVALTLFGDEGLAVVAPGYLTAQLSNEALRRGPVTLKLRSLRSDLWQRMHALVSTRRSGQLDRGHSPQEWIASLELTAGHRVREPLLAIEKALYAQAAISQDDVEKLLVALGQALPPKQEIQGR